MDKHIYRFRNWRPITAYSSSYHLDSFLVTAVVTVLLIRLSLKISGYPQLGGGDLHIAHMLYGGLFMVIAYVIQTVFLGDRPRAAASIIAGIGFGFFIDELGKFITKDNNYFFRPAILGIYALFIAMWVTFRWINRRRSKTRQARIANILELLQEGLLYGFHKQELYLLNKYIDELEYNTPASKTLTELAAHVESVAKTDRPSLYIQIALTVEKMYHRFLRWKHFRSVLVVIFIVQAALSLFTLTDYLIDLLSAKQSLSVATEVSRSQAGQLTGIVIYGLTVAYGVYKLRENRLMAYQLFRVGLILNILITQFFAFYRQQFGAVFGLMFNLLLLGMVNYIIRLESRPKQ